MVMSDLPNGRALAKAYLVEQDNLYAVNQRVCALTAYRDWPKYSVLCSNTETAYFLKFDDGVNQTHLLNHVFRNCPLPIPPTVAEQRAIAGALSDVDALICRAGPAHRQEARPQTGRHAAAPHRRQTRLPGFSGEWEVKRLGEVHHITIEVITSQ